MFQDTLNDNERTASDSEPGHGQPTRNRTMIFIVTEKNIIGSYFTFFIFMNC